MRKAQTVANHRTVLEGFQCDMYFVFGGCRWSANFKGADIPRGLLGRLIAVRTEEEYLIASQRANCWASLRLCLMKSFRAFRFFTGSAAFAFWVLGALDNPEAVRFGRIGVTTGECCGRYWHWMIGEIFLEYTHVLCRPFKAMFVWRDKYFVQRVE